jgi:type IV pilus assembly protein PilX
MQFTHTPRDRQSGAALILALIFLLLMTLLSTSSMRTATMQERMAGNTRDWNLGFQSAEAALRVAEAYLLKDSDVLPDINNADGFYNVNAANRPAWIAEPPSDGSGAITSYAISGTSQPPKYYIEKMSSIRPAGMSTETGGPVEEVYYFRVTAVGYGRAEDGGGPLAAVVLSSVYRSR